MENTVTRRTFLAAASGTALMPTMSSRGEPSAAQNKPTPSASKPRLFSGCCAYSYEKYLESKKMTMEEFILKAVELEIEGVDMTAYWFKSTQPEYLVSLRHLAKSNGVCFSGAACGASTVEADPAKRAKVLDDIKKWVDATEHLGASHLRVFAGELPKGATAAQGIAWTVETLKPACEYSGAKGITLGIEDHDGLTQQAEVCLELVRKIDFPYFGINLDISNFVGSSDDEHYQQIEACAPYATHTHIRDRFGDSGHPIDLDRVWQIFARAGYKGFMSVEYEGEEDAMTGVPKLLEQVKTLNRKYSSV
jgi:sugar phosphate isomerase/epimerase